MHYLFLALQAHSDVSKIEFEDGVVRQAGAALVAEESTIQRVVIDVTTERTLALEDVGVPSTWTGTVLITSESVDDLDAAAIAELVVDVGSVVDSWSATSSSVTDLDESWHGTVTPGPKVSFVLTPGAGVSQQHFFDVLETQLLEVQPELPGVGCRVVGATEQSGQRGGVASFWFPSEASLNEAAHNSVFSPVVTAEVVDQQHTQILMSVEHRLTPNPNAWALPTEPLMPVRDNPVE